MSKVQIKNGADVVGAIYYEAATESVVLEAFNGKNLTLKSEDTVTLDAVNMEVTDAESTALNIPPIGYVMIQFPGSSEPASLFPDTVWQKLFDDEGVFFRTEGGEASAFESGVQSYTYQSHRHGGDTYRNYTNRNTRNSGTTVSYITGSGSTYVSYAGSSETRPTNRTIRVWERVG